MSVTDLIADQLTVVRNAIRIGRDTVTIKRSGNFEGICRILKKEGFIDNYRVVEDNKQGLIKIYLKYLDNGNPVMESLTKISKPGLRIYKGSEDIKSVMGGVGIQIISTSKGLMTDVEARKQGIGGEVICEIW